MLFKLPLFIIGVIYEMTFTNHHKLLILEVITAIVPKDHTKHGCSPLLLQLYNNNRHLALYGSKITLIIF